KHVPDTEPDQRVTGVGTHTESCRHTPEVGAVCGKAARTDLCGGRRAISVPTASEAICCICSRQKVALRVIRARGLARNRGARGIAVPLLYRAASRAADVGPTSGHKRPSRAMTPVAGHLIAL